MPNMTGQPEHWTMEMNGGSSAPYLACTPCVPLFVHCLIRVEAEGLLDYQGRAGIISTVRWNLRPVTFGLDSQDPPKHTYHCYRAIVAGPTPLARTLSEHPPPPPGPEIWT